MLCERDGKRGADHADVGPGKTIFLVYLLLYRLERRLPTAIHLRGDEFFIFNADGARAEPAGGSLLMPREYWALTDSNDELTRPCSVFMRSRARVIQASNPRPDRWKDWIKQRMGQILIADLPHPLEIGAIVSVVFLPICPTVHVRSLCTAHAQAGAWARYSSSVRSRRHMGSIHSNGPRHFARARGTSPPSGNTSGYCGSKRSGGNMCQSVRVYLPNGEDPK